MMTNPIGRSGVEKAFGIVGYAWLVITNLLYLAIIAYVLDRTNQLDPKLTIVIATLGLVYVTIRGLAMSQFLAFAPALVGIAKSLDELKGRGGKRLAPAKTMPQPKRSSREARSNSTSRAYSSP